jgi:hypothetical protein
MDGHAKSEASNPNEEQKDGPRASRPPAPNAYGSYSKLTDSSWAHWQYAAELVATEGRADQKEL